MSRHEVVCLATPIDGGTTRAVWDSCDRAFHFTTTDTFLRRSKRLGGVGAQTRMRSKERRSSRRTPLTACYCSVTAHVFSCTTSSLPDDEPPPEQPPAIMPVSRVQREPTWPPIQHHSDTPITIQRQTHQRTATRQRQTHQRTATRPSPSSDKPTNEQRHASDKPINEQRHASDKPAAATRAPHEPCAYLRAPQRALQVVGSGGPAVGLNQGLEGGEGRDASRAQVVPAVTSDNNTRQEQPGPRHIGRISRTHGSRRDTDTRINT